MSNVTLLNMKYDKIVAYSPLELVQVHHILKLLKEYYNLCLRGIVKSQKN